MRKRADGALEIESLEAFVAMNEEEDGSVEEGVIGAMMPDGGWMPLICADEERRRQLEPLAVQAGRAAGVRVQLVRFGQREVIRDVTPGPN